jgi:hypothetical protein
MELKEATYRMDGLGVLILVCDRRRHVRSYSGIFAQKNWIVNCWHLVLDYCDWFLATGVSCRVHHCYCACGAIAYQLGSAKHGRHVRSDAYFQENKRGPLGIHSLGACGIPPRQS